MIDSSGNKWKQVPGIALRAGSRSFLDIWVAYDVATVAPSDGLQVTVTTNKAAGSFPISDQFNVALLDVEGLSDRTPSVNRFTGFLTYPFTVFVVFAGTSADPTSAIRILDLATHQITTLPGSQGMYSPRWSPNGRYIPAISADTKRLLLFDFQTQKWTEVAKGTMGWLEWSKDGQYLQATDGSGTGVVIRIRLSDHKTERVVDLKNFPPVGYYGGWYAVAPDDSPIMLRNAGPRMFIPSTGKNRNRFTKVQHT